MYFLHDVLYSTLLTQYWDKKFFIYLPEDEKCFYGYS